MTGVHRRGLTATITLALLAAPAANAGGPVAFEAGVASEYIGKGLSKSDGALALFGTLGVTHSGAYLSLFGSTANTAQGGDAEIIATAGYRTKLAGFDFDLGYLDRQLPGTRDGVDAHFGEYQVDIAKALNDFSGRLRFNFSPDGYGAARESWWIEAQSAWAATPSDKVSLALASRTAEGGIDYTAWNIGLKHKFNANFCADLRWYDNDSDASGDPYAGRVVGALSINF
ncbi:MAG TPA: TorF family putative porin [Hyphomonadaceae bacterium]|jgi:uncharacterized protein (TIGR02001 family)|nr:TorF family putative porin [Hyphomonadaceae bacterium]